MTSHFRFRIGPFTFFGWTFGRCDQTGISASSMVAGLRLVTVAVMVYSPPPRLWT